MAKQTSESQMVRAKTVSCEQLYARLWDVDPESGYPPKSRYEVRYEYTMQDRGYSGVFESEVPYDTGEELLVAVSLRQPWMSFLPGRKRSLRRRLVVGALMILMAGLVLYLDNRFHLGE